MMPSVQEFIQRRALTLQQFGEQCGCSRFHVSNVVAGKRAPSVKLLRRIHEVTRIPLKRLLYECT